MIKKHILFLVFISMINASHAATVKYEFDIDTKAANFTGEQITALAINNQIPGPTIEATIGDTLEVTFHNKMDVETSIHWHGVLLPNDQDGVPYLTTKPIAANSSFTYKYKITHSGTYWYHSHTGLHEQRGIYGALVFHPKNGELIKTTLDQVVVLSDWNDEDPCRVMANLKKDGDYYALKKDTVKSWHKVLRNGSMAIKNRLRSAWSRMGTMDLSDIGYDAFLSNGKKQSNLNALAGNTMRIRLINAAASSYFNIEFAGGPMTIVSADGVNVEPIKIKRLSMAIAETYDVIIDIPNNKSYELRSTSADGTGYSSVFIGKGSKVFAPDIPKPNLFLMKHEMQQESKHDIIKHMKNYDSLRSIDDTNFSNTKSKHEVTLNLTGNMEKYVWSFNNETLTESDKISIKKGEIVRFVLNNKTMMQHPIHLHGHFFRVLNGQEDRSPLKHTVNVAPMSKVTIEFEANAEKDWFFHCHNLYHMKAGMARVVSYKDSSAITKDIFPKLTGDNSWYYKSDLAGLSNMTMGTIRASNTRNALEIEYDYDYKKEYDVEVIYARNFTRFFNIYAGGNFERQDKNRSSENTAIFGFRYMLPLLIESNLRVDSKGDFRLELSSNLQLTNRTNFEWSYNTDKEYQFNLVYELTKQVLLNAVYDSDFKWGAGARIKF